MSIVFPTGDHIFWILFILSFTWTYKMLSIPWRRTRSHCPVCTEANTVVLILLLPLFYKKKPFFQLPMAIFLFLKKLVELLRYVKATHRYSGLLWIHFYNIHSHWAFGGFTPFMSEKPDFSLGLVWSSKNASSDCTRIRLLSWP